jgi:hypothetical protein
VERSSDERLQKAGNSSTIECIVAKGSPLLGKRIRITGWIKCKDVQNWAAAYICIWSEGLGYCRFDQMSDRNILRGTMDWQKVEFITDVPDEPCEIYAGPDLYGPGELWGDDFQIDLAPPDAAVNDDRTWHIVSDIPNSYSETVDNLVMHDEHPTVCVASALNMTPPGASASWTQTVRAPDFEKYEGHSLCMSGWVKIENVSGSLRPSIQAWRKKGVDNMIGDYKLQGTLDWTHFTVTCTVAKDTRKIDTSFILSGSGKFWIDTNSIEYSIVN